MTLVRYGQAAMIAAIMVLMGNSVWAQQAEPKCIRFELKTECCKDGKCYSCKEVESCCDSKKCDAKCSCCKDGKCCSQCKKGDTNAIGACCKDSKCACCKDRECGCDKKGKCSCGEDNTVSTKAACGCCPIMSKLAKHTAIIMVMPASMPLPACCMEAMGMMPHPQMPPGPHVWMPPMMPPFPPIPPTPSMGIGAPMMPPMNVDWCLGYASCPAHGNTVFAASAPSVVPCSATPPATPAKVCITAASASDQLEVDVGDETCIRCKKMTIKIGDNEITLSRFDDRVRVRGEDLKATADCIHSDRKERLILEGDVVLHYKKDGHCAHVHGERIELNLSSSAMTIQKAVKAPPSNLIEHLSK